MKKARLLCVALALGVAAVPVMSQQAAQTKRTAYRSGHWYVERSKDNSNGTVACAGFYLGQPGVQLNTDSLVVAVPGELRSITLRFDSEPARAPRAPDRMELQTGGVMLAGPDLEHLRQSRTLDIDVTTAQGKSRHQLNLEGLDASLKNIQAGCPVPAAATRADRARQKAHAKAAAQRCSSAGIARMRERGLGDVRIKGACPKADLPAQ